MKSERAEHVCTNQILMHDILSKLIWVIYTKVFRMCRASRRRIHFERLNERFLSLIAPNTLAFVFLITRKMSPHYRVIAQLNVYCVRESERRRDTEFSRRNEILFVKQKCFSISHTNYEIKNSYEIHINHCVDQYRIDLFIQCDRKAGNDLQPRCCDRKERESRMR